MRTFDVAVNASYQTHRNHARLREDADAYFTAQGLVLWLMDPHAANPDLLKAVFMPLESGEEQDVTQANVDAFMAQHNNNVQTAGQQAETEMQSGKQGLADQIDQAIVDYTLALANWDTLTTLQQKAVNKRHALVLLQLLKYMRREVLS